MNAERPDYSIDKTVVSQAEEKYDRRPSRLRGFLITIPFLIPIVVFVACRASQGNSPTPTPTEVVPTPTPNVPMYDLEEVDTNGDGLIGMPDLMDQMKGKECLPCENRDFDRGISNNDVRIEQDDVARANSTGEYDRRADINNDGKDDILDVNKVIADLGKPVPSNGRFRADNVERGWSANQVGVRFEQGSDKEANLAKLYNLYQNGGSETDIAVKEAKKAIIESLGLRDGWSVSSVSPVSAEIVTPSPPKPNRFIVILVIPPDVLGNVTLGGVINMVKLKTDVAGAFRNHLVIPQ